MVNAIILAGGLGTRLAQIVSHLPKTLAPIRGVPFLHLLLQQLQISGIVSKVILALGYKAPDVQAFLSKQSFSFQVDCAVEPAPLGTGGALLNALPKSDSETLLVLNGDSYFDLPLHSFLSFHRSQKAHITIACRQVEDTSRYGAIEMDPSFRITQFREKSSAPRPGYVNAGLYLIEKESLFAFPPGPCSLEKDFFPSFLRKQVFGYPHVGTFIDIGTPNSYNEAQEILKPWIAK